MGKNFKPRSSINRSISFNKEVYAALELHRKDLRADRAPYLNDVLEHVLGIAEHPELHHKRIKNIMDDPRYPAVLAEVERELAAGHALIQKPKGSFTKKSKS